MGEVQGLFSQELLHVRWQLGPDQGNFDRIPSKAEKGSESVKLCEEDREVRSPP